MRASTISVVPRLSVVLLAALGISSCALITFDCGASSFRETLSSGVVGDVSDTVHLSGYAKVFEERGEDGSYIHQLVVGVQSAPAAIPDSIPTFLRQHVTAVRLELAPGNVVYRVTMPPNSAHLFGPSVLAVVANDNMPQDMFDSIRAHLLSNHFSIVLETDIASLQLQRSALRIEDSYDWRKAGCK